LPQAGISELMAKKLRDLFPFLNPQSALYVPKSVKYFSIGQQRILFVLALLILSILYFKFYYHPLSPSHEENIRETVIEVIGEVQKPGIYIFQNPPVLRDAIEKAGGLKAPAFFNPRLSTEFLETGTSLTIKRESPQEVKIKMGRMEANKLLVFSIPFDLNSASVEDLCLIPGIGESMAREIIAYRERRRKFRSVEELKNVKGIGEKKWRTFKPFLTIRQPP
jgi:competence protein ComEA